MARSFTERLLGGVCGGLSHRTPLNASLWRVLWVALFLIAPPAALASYLLWWWLVPLESPFRKQSYPVSTLMAFILSVVVFAGWFARASFVITNGQDALGNDIILYETYLPFIGLILAGAFLYRQVQGRSWPNVIIGVVLVCVPILVLMGMYNILPGGLFDLIGRALPGVLVFLGLALLLRGRVPYGTPIALFATLVIIVTLVTTAIATRTNRTLETPPQIVEQQIEPDINLLQFNLEALTTDVRVTTGDAGSRTVKVTFIGSTENKLDTVYDNPANGSGRVTYTVQETQISDYPRLENLGRGKMTVEVPPDIGLALAFGAESGAAELDLREADLERLTVDLDHGDALLTLPAYEPRSPGALDDADALNVLDGRLQIIVPAALGGRFEIPPNSTPQYDESQYRIEVATPFWLLIARNYDASTMKANYHINVPNGTADLRVQE